MARRQGEREPPRRRVTAVTAVTRERRPAEDQAATVLADERNSSTVRRWPSWRQATRPPDVRATYPDPTLNFTRVTPYGLTLDELRAEWRRHKDWQKWELEARLLPTAVSR